MPMLTAGAPLTRLSVSSVAAPSSSRATSPIRSTLPSGLARRMILPNSSGVISRPLVCRLIWNCVAFEVGRAPMRPTAPCTFWLCSAAMMSDGIRFSATSRSVSNQMRIE